MDTSALTVQVRVADYPQVKAVLDAAADVIAADDSAPWALSEAIDSLRESLDELDKGSEAPPPRPCWAAHCPLFAEPESIYCEHHLRARLMEL